jgi:spoIIIJ-associated protein
MTNAVNSIEITARSLDAAVRQALEQLGAAEDEVIIEILASPRTGLLGLGARPARVRVTRRSQHAASAAQGAQQPLYTDSGQPSAVQSEPPTPAQTNSRASRGLRTPAVRQASARKPDASSTACENPLPAVEIGPSRFSISSSSGSEEEVEAKPSKTLDEQRREAVAVLSEVLALMGEQVRACAVENEDEVGEHAAIEINLEGQNTGLLIGRRGQTLEALEYIINRIMARRIDNPAPVLLDIESYYARRNQRLVRTALALGEQVKRQRKPVRLKPMPPRERRVIHMTLRDDPLLVTESSGAGYLRAVKILPAAQRHQSAPAARGRA